jgi:DNA-binding transcriptional ArsR family regulator
MLDLDRTIHEPARLKVMMILSGVDSADFCSICQTLELTHGNLSAHVSKLEAARYVRMKKTIVGKVPHTEFSLTKKGRKALAVYLDCFDQIRRLSIVWTTGE